MPEELKRYRHLRVTKITIEGIKKTPGYRHHVSTGNMAHEWQVGPVPAKDGMVYRKGGGVSYVDLDKLHPANEIDVFLATTKVQTHMTFVAVYHRNCSGDRKKPKFRWTQTHAMSVNDLQDSLIQSTKDGDSMETKAQRILALNWKPCDVLAWRFIEVY